MNINKEPLSDTSAKIVVSIEEADYKDKVTAELKKSARHTPSPVSARAM